MPRLSLNQYVYYVGLIWIIKTMVEDGRVVTLYRMHGDERSDRWKFDVPGRDVYTEDELRKIIYK